MRNARLMSNLPNLPRLKATPAAAPKPKPKPKPIVKSTEAATTTSTSAEVDPDRLADDLETIDIEELEDEERRMEAEAAEAYIEDMEELEELEDAEERKLQAQLTVVRGDALGLAGASKPGEVFRRVRARSAASTLSQSSRGGAEAPAHWPRYLSPQWHSGMTFGSDAETDVGSPGPLTL